MRYNQDGQGAKTGMVAIPKNVYPTEINQLISSERLHLVEKIGL